MSVLEQEINPTTLREDWLQSIDHLLAEVEGWAKEWLAEYDWTPAFGWDVLKTSTEIEDDFSSNKYVAPVLEINALAPLMKLPPEKRLVPEQKLVLAPISLNPLTGTGRVDFYAWPTLYRVRLLHDGTSGQWSIKTDSGLDWPHRWQKSTFIELAEGLLRA